MLVYRSNRLDLLADRLAQLVAEPGLGVLEAETILIQTAGMQRWLSRELSQRLGILAGAHFPFPRTFLRELMDRVLGEEESSQRYEREFLAWHLFRLLEEPRPDPAFALVRRFLEQDREADQRFRLAERLAHLFDQYMMYRPELLSSWEQAADPGNFQCTLWREVVAELGPHHFAARSKQFVEQVPLDELRAHLPSRLSLVGGPGLPPRFLELLAHMGQACDVHVFSFAVCQEYFGDAATPEDDLLSWSKTESLHPLLRSMGQLGADYQKILESLTYQEADQHFVPPAGESILAHLQRDILAGRVRPPEERLPEELRADRSFLVDACHSPLREVEVLHERILAALREDPSLALEDIVVLVPQIDLYSPLISSVFGEREDGAPALSFRIADRKETTENPAASAFLSVLRLLVSRMTGSDLLDFFQAEPVRLRFGWEMDELERIGHWVRSSGIRWGLDAAHRAEWGTSRHEQNTWQAGLARLLLGYVMADEGAELWQGTVPWDDVAASDAATLGRLLDLVQILTEFRQHFTRAGLGLREARRSVGEWCGKLRSLCSALFVSERESDLSCELLFEALALIEERAERAVCSEAVSFTLMAHLLETELSRSRPSTDFLSGGITFCELLPLRTIPFRVICVLGLNQKDFPRADQPLSFDQMRGSRRWGDRSIRAEDRYLFLEMLMAAQDRVFLSYVGRDVQDNTEKPPSVLLAELSSAVEQLFQEPREKREESYLAPCVHPLQPFSPRYFDGEQPELQSSSQRWLSGARALQEAGRSEWRWMDSQESLPVALPEWIELEDLARFYQHPAEAFLRRLGVETREQQDALEDREPAELSALTRHQLGQRLFQMTLQERTPDEEIELRRGEFPQGAAGRVSYTDLMRAVQQVSAAAQEYRSGSPRSENFQLRGSWIQAPQSEERARLEGATRVQGIRAQLEPFYGSIRLELLWNRLTTQRKLSAWIRHLACCAVPLSSFTESICIGRDPKSRAGVEVWRLKRMEPAKAREQMARLLDWYLIGQSRPLCFQVEASAALWRAFLRKKEEWSVSELRAQLHEQAWRQIDEQKFFGTSGKRPEDHLFLQVFGRQDPFRLLSEGELPLEENECFQLAQEIYSAISEAEEGE